MLKNVPIVCDNNIIITINILLYSIPIGIFFPNRHEMIITRIIVVGTILF